MIYYNYSKGGEQKLNIAGIKKKPIVELNFDEMNQLKALGYSISTNANGNLVIIGRV